MDIAIKHANEFKQLIHTESEIKCVEYIDKYNDFYDTIAGIWSPLTYACNYEKFKVVYKLLDVGADINLSVSGWNALMYVSYLGNIDVATELLRRGANINYKNSRYSSALSIACTYGRDQLAAILIKMGADFVELLDYYNICFKTVHIIQSIRDVYRQRIIAIIDGKSGDNAMAVSFRTTYAVGVVDIIAEFII
ncbi:MAG: hypothetical protein Faunusvirus2_28 [Faunusvirus sp.]|jgi:hypothetical protein|uniref:Uncharacterized protein n=1 Tax=Faunusvirus sp. TaxID=2487766 RepID=A0A3G4ZYJ9_9VIRU|nr:MAG: hypothetical protein Faunusvirus2_28 [Faunusvirus sp.]